MSKLSDKALGIQTEKGEPVYTLRASNPFSGMVLRFMANAGPAIGISLKEQNRIREVAAAMDAWRERNSGGG